MKYCFKILILSLILWINSFSQKSDNEFEEIVQKIVEESDNQFIYDEIYEKLKHYYDNPLNLNACNSEQLQNLYVLNAYQIYNILNYRRKVGQLCSIYEMRLVEGLSQSQIESILPFVTVEELDTLDDFKLKNLINRQHTQMFFNNTRLIQEKEGFKNGKYLGQRNNMMFKLKYDSKQRVMIGLTARTSEGESFFESNNNNGFDFYSAYLQLNKFFFDRIILGDYKINMGQGLISNFSYASSKMLTNINKSIGQSSLQFYSSTNEKKYFRGLAFNKEFGVFELTLFASHKPIDAIFDDSTNLVSSFNQLGLHRTTQEISKEDNLNETIFGTSLKYRNKRLTLGFNSMYFTFDKIIKPDKKPYQKYDFEGKRCLNISTDYTLLFHKFEIFGEIAFARHYYSGYAFVNGITYMPVPQLSLQAIYRNYDKKYCSFYSSAFVDKSEPSNETGFYLGFDVYPFKRMNLKFYLDYFKHDFFEYCINSPSEGHEYFAQAYYPISRKIALTFRFKDKLTQKSVSGNSSSIKDIEQIDKKQLRIELALTDIDGLNLKSRLEFVFINNDVSSNSKGLMYYQDIQYSISSIPLDISLRYTFFNTDNYASSIYVYENDLLYGLSSNMFYDKGYNLYTVLHSRLSKTLSIRLKLSNTHFKNLNSIEAGNDLVQGKNRTEVKAQIVMRF